MAKNLVYVACMFALALGCGTSSPDSEQDVVEVAPPSNSMPKTTPQESVPLTPPGSIEMPEGVAIDPASPTATTPAPGARGGFEMPPLDPDNAPVIVQRPVLDTPVVDDKEVGESDKEPANVTLTAATLDEIRGAIAKKGQVCVVDFWSLACEPCLKEFPGLVQLHQELGGKLECVSVNVDFDGRKSKPAETYRPRAEAFLSSANATFKNYLCGTPNEDAYASLKIVSIPAVLVFDDKGTLVRTFTDAGNDAGFTYAKDIAPLVKSLIDP
jgi:thiol-disulfide isomerase/thioredoxin